MAEREKPRHEGWQVAQRPAVLGAVLVPLGLLGSLLLAGRAYEGKIEPRHFQPVRTFPAPGVETFIHDGTGDPHRPKSRPAPDRGVEAAEREIVQEGLPGWTR